MATTVGAAKGARDFDPSHRPNVVPRTRGRYGDSGHLDMPKIIRERRERLAAPLLPSELRMATDKTEPCPSEGLYPTTVAASIAGKRGPSGPASTDNLFLLYLHYFPFLN